VPYEWSERMNQIIQNVPQGMKVARMRFPEPVVDVSRDKAVQTAIQMGARWLWFCDTDLMWPPDVLPRLMAHNQMITSGLYVRRHNPPFNEMLKFRQDGNPGLQPIRDGEYQPGELVKCDAVATGGMLLRMDLFEQLKPFQIAIDGVLGRPAWFLWTEWRSLNPNESASEDFSFCMRAARQGIPSYCDTSLAGRHLGPVRFAPSGNNSLSIEFMGT